MLNEATTKAIVTEMAAPEFGNTFEAECVPLQHTGTQLCQFE